MNTRIFSANSRHVVEAAEMLRHGELVAFPTETVYGLGAVVFNETALRRIFEVKGRPADNPLIVHIADASQARELSADLPVECELLFRAFSPGPLTVVVPSSPRVSALITAGLNTVAIRIPAHPVALRLITAVGEPLAAPSANRSGRPSPTTARHVLDDLDGQIAGVIDGGACSIGIESTVVSLASAGPVILRPGAISAGEIANVLGKPVIYADVDEPAASPGMKYRHYAPDVPVILVNPMDKLPNNPGNCVILAVEPPAYLPAGTEYRRLSAATFYAELRRADTLGKDAVFVVLSPETISQPGLMNRLTKAAAKV